MWAIILQAAPPESLSPLVSLGVGGAIAVLAISFWRNDRKDSERRYAELAQDFRNIVQDNTKALVALVDKLDQNKENAATLTLLIEALRRNKLLNIEP